MTKRNIKVLTAKMGLDCHDTGIVSVSHMLRDSGYEVIYLGLHNSAEKIVQAAIDEDVQLIGISFLSGQHLPQTKKLLEEMEKQKVDILVMVGGVIPKSDVPKLNALGVQKVFTPGTLVADIDAWISQAVRA